MLGSITSGGASSVAGPSRFVLNPPTRNRRVPDDLRQRGEISCDRCKQRKRRCERQGDSETCTTCQEVGAECVATLPRKRRLITPQPSARYATLDAIVRKLYPDAEIDTVAGLAAVAKELGVVPAKARKKDIQDEEELRVRRRELDSVGPLEIPEGWLVPAPRGGHHYVGPSSLVYFARCARQLVAKSNIHKHPNFDDAGLRRYLQAAAFTTYKTSHTIEANLQDHPATFAAGTEQSPSATVLGETERSRPSPGGDGFRHVRLPGRQTADRLVSAFFQRVHPNIPILHRGAFHVLYDQAFRQEVNLALEPGKACTLYMVLTLGAQALEESLTSARAIQQQYLAIVIREGLGRLVLTSTLANVQALILLALYQHNAGERNTAYILIGQAIRAAVSSGLHKDGDNNVFDDPFERNSRRTVWWYLHIFEQTVSLALGRPSFTDAIHVNTTLPDTSFELSIGLPLGYLEAYVSLSQFIVKIKQTVGIVSVHYEDASKLMEHYELVMKIHADLINWKKSLPSGLALGQAYTCVEHRRLIIMLQVWADYFESVLCRPYLLCRVNQDLQDGPSFDEIDEIAEHAVSAAHASVTKLLLLSDYDTLEGSVWLDFYAAQHAIMILSLQFLGQPNSTEWDDSREPIARLIDVSQKMRLAPTYRITMNVALQLSCISGIGPDVAVDLSAPTAGTPDNAPDFLAQTTFPDPTVQLFGPMPPTIHQASEPAIFSDLYNLDYNADSTNPWDFFGVAGFADEFFQPAPNIAPGDLDA